MKLTRRTFLKTSAVVGAGVALPCSFLTSSAHGAIPNSQNLRKWVQRLRGLTALGDTSGIPVASAQIDPVFNIANGYPYNAEYYQIAAGEFTDQLHPDLPNPTRLWGYYDTRTGLKRHLGGLIIASRGTPVRIRMTNVLPGTHILPVDTTLPGANQAQNRIAVHLHGGFIPWISDGGPFDWWTPTGVSGLSFPNGPGGVLDLATGRSMQPGQADYWYPNDQSMRLMWYHDHAHGITRLNAYAGVATGYLLLDGINAGYMGSGAVPGLDSTVPLVIQDKIFVGPNTPLLDPTWANVVPTRAQVPGSLWYEHIYDPKLYKLLKGAGYMVPPNPSCVPEFFGDTLLCNGTVYPYAEVEAKRYRFLILNACNSRFMNLNLFQANPKNVDGIDLDPRLLFPLNPPGPNMIMIGNEAGFLVTEATFVSPKQFNPATFGGNLILAPAERADIIIDFTGQAGKEFILYNDAPAPFPAGPPSTDYYLGNPNNPIQPITIQDKQQGLKWSTGPDTRQVLRIKVKAAVTADPQPAGNILDPTLIDPPLLSPITTTVAPIPPLPIPAHDGARQITLNEGFDAYGRLMQTLGTTAPNLVGKGFGLEYLAPPTEVVQAGSVEIWQVFNNSADTHPLHFHLVNVQILSRQPFVLSQGMFLPAGVARGPDPDELGWKETVKMHPGEVTTVVMKFTLPNTPFVVPSSTRATMAAAQWGMGLPAGPTYHEFVYHCHILEHEEHDMMRPLIVKS